MNSFVDPRFLFATEVDQGSSVQRSNTLLTTEMQETPWNQVILRDSDVTNSPHTVRNTLLTINTKVIFWVQSLKQGY